MWECVSRCDPFHQPSLRRPACRACWGYLQVSFAWLAIMAIDVRRRYVQVPLETFTPDMGENELSRRSYNASQT